MRGPSKGRDVPLLPIYVVISSGSQLSLLSFSLSCRGREEEGEREEGEERGGEMGKGRRKREERRRVFSTQVCPSII